MTTSEYDRAFIDLAAAEGTQELQWLVSDLSATVTRLRERLAHVPDVDLQELVATVDRSSRQVSVSLSRVGQLLAAPATASVDRFDRFDRFDLAETVVLAALAMPSERGPVTDVPHDAVWVRGNRSAAEHTIAEVLRTLSDDGVDAGEISAALHVSRRQARIEVSRPADVLSARSVMTLADALERASAPDDVDSDIELRVDDDGISLSGRRLHILTAPGRTSVTVTWPLDVVER